MRYFFTSPWWLRMFYPSYVWRIDTTEKKIYLTFDDGPHPAATPFVLDELKKYNAKATFFCIGKNVIDHPSIFQRIIEEGHAVGNHTFNHVNGWKTGNDDYISDVIEASKCIDSSLFRPPYGRIKRSQAKRIPLAMNKENARVVMWSLLTGDFDLRETPQRCLQRTMRFIRPGSIVVFHDSEKAFARMSYVLPRMMETLSNDGYRFEKME